jgi:hypothetical protein
MNGKTNAIVATLIVSVLIIGMTIGILNQHQNIKYLHGQIIGLQTTNEMWSVLCTQQNQSYENLVKKYAGSIRNTQASSDNFNELKSADAKNIAIALKFGIVETMIEIRNNPDEQSDQVIEAVTAKYEAIGNQ